MATNRAVLLSAVCLFLVMNAGCANIWHNLQPHRMWKLNSGAAPSMDPEFTEVHMNTGEKLVSHVRTNDSHQTIVVRSQSRD